MAELKTNAIRLLDKAKIPYTMHTYTQDGGIDALAVAAKLGEPPELVYKTLVTQGRDGYFVFVIPAGAELDLKKAAKTVGQKAVELIPVKALNQVTGYIRGGCSPLGMKKAYPTVIAQSAQGLEIFYVSAGRVGLQMALSPAALSELTGADFADIIA